MSLEQEVELIRKFPIFSMIAPAKQKLLCFSSDRLTYAPGQEMFHAGDVGDACYVVIDGVVEITVDTTGADGSAQRLLLSLVERNGLIGEIATFGNAHRTATATAKTRVEVLRISAELFRSVIRENPDAAIELIRVLAERLTNTTEHLARAQAELATLRAQASTRDRT